MKRLLYVFWVIGFALFVWLLLREGLPEVIGAVGSAGIGVLAVVAWHALPVLADTFAWSALFPARQRPPFGRLLRLRWIGESVNTLLPVAQVGGDLVRARLLTRQGVAGSLSGASLVVDLTTAVLTQIVFALIGVGFLVAHGADGGAVRFVLLGLGVFSLLIVGFYAAQRAGLFGGLVRLLQYVAAGADWTALSEGGDALDREVVACYRRRPALVRSCVYRFGAWVLGTGEVWLALSALGHPVSVVEALMLEALGNAVRGAAFAIPGALGVQEGGYLLLGSLVGLPGETALALSLLKRVRELTLGLPGLVVWQVAEGRRRLGRGRVPPDGGAELASRQGSKP